MNDVSFLAREVQSLEQVSRSMSPSLINRFNSFDKKRKFVRGWDDEAIMSVSLCQLAVNQSLRKKGKREREREGVIIQMYMYMYIVYMCIYTQKYMYNVAHCDSI